LTGEKTKRFLVFAITCVLLAWLLSEIQVKGDDLQIKEQANKSCKENCGPRPESFVQYKELEEIFDLLKNPNDRYVKAISSKGVNYQIQVIRLEDYSAASQIQQ